MLNDVWTLRGVVSEGDESPAWILLDLPGTPPTPRKGQAMTRAWPRSLSSCVKPSSFAFRQFHFCSYKRICRFASSRGIKHVNGTRMAAFGRVPYLCINIVSGLPPATCTRGHSACLLAGFGSSRNLEKDVACYPRPFPARPALCNTGKQARPLMFSNNLSGRRRVLRPAAHQRGDETSLGQREAAGLLSRRVSWDLLYCVRDDIGFRV